MLLLSDRIGFANPRGKLIIEIFEIIDAKRVEMIPRRESLHLHKARMLKPACKDKVTNEKVFAHLHGYKGDPHLKGYARLFRQHLHSSTFPDHRRERIEQFAHVF